MRDEQAYTQVEQSSENGWAQTDMLTEQKMTRSVEALLFG